jgi:hypothetical protein
VTTGAFLLFLFVGLPVLCAVVVWGFFDAGDRPLEAWAQAGRSRQFWLRAQAIGIFLPPVVTIVYLVAVRPRLEQFTPPPEELPEGPAEERPAEPPGAG